MKKVYYNKLIRDNIPQKIRANGGEFEVREMDEKEYERELLRKVEEEASGLINSSSREDIITELSDVLDVVDEIKRLKKISEVEIQDAREKAYTKKGGFEKKLFLVWSSDTGYKTNEKRTPKES
jgi:predicted house-cleaning noncanonical NTP pyrophosphatase (MazG superfamily)